jgi:hypothetical protein
MSTLADTRLQPSPAGELLTPRKRTRLLDVGVRDADHDAATIRWAVGFGGSSPTCPIATVPDWN